MAPDLNSVPPSPHPIASTHTTSSTHASRRPSHSTSMSQAAQPAPLSPGLSSHVLPSNQSAVSGQANTRGAGTSGAQTDAGPGPLRHPRPLTAADLHLQLEKEQEAVVNRLTRELSILRAAQNASVVSNTSSTSGTGLPDTQDHNANHMLSGPSHPAPSQRRHHRSSSGASSRSVAAAGLVNMVPSTTADRNRTSSAVTGGLSMSRQNSSSNRRSGASSPAPSGSFHMESFPLLYQTQSRPTIPHREVSGGNLSSSLSNTGVELTGRYEELAWQRMELENVKRENEGLKRRIRELERMVRQGRGAVAGDGVNEGNDRVRSESVSTNATDAAVRGRERGESSLEEGGVSVNAG